MQRVSEIENAVVQALQAGRDAAGFRVDTIESYGGQLDDDTLEWVRRLPAIWVVFSGVDKVRAIDAGKRRWAYQGSFTVFCAQRNLAGNEAVRQGDARNPGVYALMQLARVALLGRDLGLTIDAFAPGPVKVVSSLVVNRDAVMVFGMTFTTVWIETVQEPALTPEGELITIGLQYFLKPGDDLVDAADTITTRT